MLCAGEIQQVSVATIHIHFNRESLTEAEWEAVQADIQRQLDARFAERVTMWDAKFEGDLA